MPTSSVPSIPLVYRLLLLYLEPLAAFNGAILSHFQPTLYLRTMSPRAVYAPSSQVVFDQLAATYFLFAFNEAVVLRVANDLRVWKAMVLGILICDIIHLYGSWLALGTENMLNPWLWRWEDAVNIGMLVGPGAMRIAFLMGVGIAKSEKAKEH